VGEIDWGRESWESETKQMADVLKATKRVKFGQEPLLREFGRLEGGRQTI